MIALPDEQVRDGGMDNHNHNLNTEFRVEKVVRRSGKAAAPFARGGVSGKSKSMKSRSQSANSNAATTKPKTGPSSRSGKGAYVKKLKPNENVILSPSNSSQSSFASPRKQTRQKTTNRIDSD